MEQTLGVGTGQSEIMSLKIQRYKMGSHNPGNRGLLELSLIWKLKVDSCFSAKLGDTKELEDFIADLDRTLASEYAPRIKKIKQKTNQHR